MAQAGNRAGKTQPCMQMGENELEWVSVTSGNMNVLNSALIFFVRFEGNEVALVAMIGSRYTLDSCCKAVLFATLAKVRFQ